jgi:hypothetical protein
LLTILTVGGQAYGQMPPPGYERAKQIEAERMGMSSLDRDSITMIDTIVIFDPETYESETRIVEHTISIGDYCKTFLGIGDPEILKDGQPHTIIDPKTYEEITIRLNPAGRIDTIPK